MKTEKLIEWQDELHRSIRRIDGACLRFFKPWKLSRNAFRVLYSLYTEASSGLEPAELAEGANLVRPTITILLNELESKGMVLRRDSTADRRKKIITLTEKGREITENAIRRFSEIETEIFERFDERELAVMTDVFSRYSMSLLQKTTDALESSGAPRFNITNDSRGKK